MKTLLLLILFVVGALGALGSTGTLNATHFWDCSGGACDSTTLQPWNQQLYRYAPEYAPMVPTNPLYGESIWMTGAFNLGLSRLMDGDDGCCGKDDNGGGGCGKCVLVTNQNALNSHWKVLVMKKNYCPPWSNHCQEANTHLDFAVPGFDFAGASTANICGQDGTYISQ